MGIKVTTKGKWAKTKSFLHKWDFDKEIKILEEFGQRGIDELALATPVDTGTTALSWYYEVVREDDGRVALRFCNSNINGYTPIAIIIQYGHATKSGGWVEGIDYINPVIDQIFNEISAIVWKEVIR